MDNNKQLSHFRATKVENGWVVDDCPMHSQGYIAPQYVFPSLVALAEWLTERGAVEVFGDN